jgi:hypothetical protein
MPVLTRMGFRAWLLLAGSLIGGAAHASGVQRVFAAAIPGGGVRVLVVITNQQWPVGGLRIEDGKGAVLVPRIASDRAAYAQLDPGAQRAIDKLAHPLAMSGATVQAWRAILTLRLVSDWTFARAAGAGLELPAGLHPHSIRIALLGADGVPTATLGPVEVQSDAGAPMPRDLRAAATPEGISLRWQGPARGGKSVPAYAFVVARTAGNEHDQLMRHPTLMSAGKPGQPFVFTDRTPPVGSALTYALRFVDALGVSGAPASVSVYSPDFAAGSPPRGQIAKAGRGVVTLTWEPITNARTAGLIVERSQLAQGPYELLTPAGLDPKSTTFADRRILPGAVYYYRVRAVMPDGLPGATTDPVRAQPLASTPLLAPQGLTAQIGISQIALRWQPVPGASVAGYIVERRADTSAPRWARLNTRLAPNVRYIDAIGPSQGGSFEYRVTAVATDEGLSPPSAILRVTLRDTTPPMAPAIVSASGADGRVKIHFNPAEPVEKTVRVALLRSASASERGLVVGAPVDARSGLIEDTWVRGGQVYWYRLVAFDKAGNRSGESRAIEIRVAAAKLPQPGAPQALFIAKPAPHVKLTFAAPPSHARIIVEVRRDGGRWQTILGPLVGTEAVDLEPPGPHPTYRIVYVGEDGGGGIPSDTASPR